MTDRTAHREGIDAAVAYLAKTFSHMNMYNYSKINMIKLDFPSRTLIDLTNPRKLDLPSEKTEMPEERHVVREGLKMGLNLGEMKFACPQLGTCVYEYLTSHRKGTRSSFCHNAVNYQNCEAYKK